MVSDDVQALDESAQIALFNAINRTREGRGAVLAAGDAPPGQLALREDLRSRLGWGLVYQLKALSDEDKTRHLRAEAERRGLRLSEEVIRYLLSRLPGDLPSLNAALELLDVVPTAANIEFHARIVRDKALLRRLIDVGTQLVQAAYEGRHDVGTLLDEAEQRVFEVSNARGTQEVVRIKELMWQTMERIEARHRGDDSVRGVASGFTDLDLRTNGFQRSDLIVVAARPSMGKTAFCLNVAANAALEHKVPVAVFSL